MSGTARFWDLVFKKGLKMESGFNKSDFDVCEKNLQILMDNINSGESFFLVRFFCSDFII